MPTTTRTERTARPVPRHRGGVITLTVPGLILLLPGMGRLGAALVSLGAYSASLILLMFGARRHLGASWGIC